MKAQAIIAGAEACGHMAMRMLTRIGNTLGPMGPDDLDEVATSLSRGLAMADRDVVAAVRAEAVRMRCAHVGIAIGRDSVHVGKDEVQITPEVREMLSAIRLATQSKRDTLATYMVHAGGDEQRAWALDGIARAASFLESCGYPRRAQAAILSERWAA